MRRALDPANQSLQEALRLSYRLLQVAMLALVTVFLLSGFQSVQEGWTGVRTIFGAISGEAGTEAVTPGLSPFWPYPVGELRVLPQKRTIDLRDDFWPRLQDQSQTIEAASAGADVSAGLRPGLDGFVITADGDLGHLRLKAEYSIIDPVDFLSRFEPARADALVTASLRRAVVQVASKFTLAQLIEARDEIEPTIRSVAQKSLDGMGAGIQLDSVSVPDRIAPLSVRNQIANVQARREDAKVYIEKARQESSSKLVGAAGPNYAEVLALIGKYEGCLTAGDIDAAEAQLKLIGARLEQDDIGGEASRIIARSRAYRAHIDSGLGKEARRVAGLAPSFHENPQQLVRQLWLEAVRDVMSQPQVEVFAMPRALSMIDVSITSSPDVMQVRRNAELERKKREAQMLGANDPAYNLGSRQINIDRAGRKLDETGTTGAGRQ
ncbi:MAG: hypothetical protein EXS00_07345 [Phycisphaerales bacterium]|nr:hypothetical protein [Phycisphaerales bacterium]